MRKLHLSLGVGSLSPHSKNVENERRAVKYLHSQLLLYISHLLGRKLVIEDDHSHLPLVVFLVFNELLNFLKLSFSNVCCLAWPCHSLREPPYGYSSSGVGKKFQLIKVFLCLGLILLLGNQSHQDGSLGLSL